MKKLSILCSCLMCLTMTQAQNLKSNENQVIMDPAITSSLLVCRLTGPEFQKRKAALQEEIFTQVKVSEEIEDGYIFYFADEHNFVEKLVDYTLAEKKCCPFFQFDLTIKPNNEGLALKLTGPPEAKEMVSELVAN